MREFFRRWIAGDQKMSNAQCLMTNVQRRSGLSCTPHGRLDFQAPTGKGTVGHLTLNIEHFFIEQEAPSPALFSGHRNPKNKKAPRIILRLF
jgi:hypothetical protein